MKYFLFSFLSLLLIVTTSCHQATEGFGIEPHETTEAGLNWYTIEDLEIMQHIENRKVLVDLYTGWCGWCKKMDQNTFTDPEVVAFLNKNFVLVKFNAEQKEPIQFKGETYENVKVGRRKTNRLAVKFMDGRIGYPTIVYLDGSNLEKIKSSPGYKDAPQLLMELQKLVPIINS